MTEIRNNVEITIDPMDAQDGKTWYVIAEAYTGGSLAAARESGGDVHRYTIRVTPLVPFDELSEQPHKIMLDLGSDKAAAVAAAYRLADSGRLPEAFQPRTDAGTTRARVTNGSVADEVLGARTGRPPIGPEVKTRLTVAEIHELDDDAFALGIPRSELIRRYIREAMRTELPRADIAAALHRAGIDPDAITTSPAGGETIYTVTRTGGGRVSIGTWTAYDVYDEIEASEYAEGLAQAAAEVARRS
jgi:hypothetical protein